MKKILVLAFACLSITACDSEPEPEPEPQSEYSEAINYGKLQFSNVLSDGLKFSGVWFSPNSVNGKPDISGYVCGNLSGKNIFGEYVGERPFFIYVGHVKSGFFNGKPIVVQKGDERSMQMFKEYCKK